MKKTVLVITGTRAEYGLLRPVMREILRSKKLALQVLVTGAHTIKKYGNTQEQVRADGMPIAAVVPVRLTDSMTDALSREIKGIGAHCAKRRPDLILVQGDRDESFAGAIVGGHLGIPVAHIHGGDVTGWVVDEYIRHATTKFSHLHFPATKKSAERIRKLGEEPWRIIMAGGPGLDEIRTLPFVSKQQIAKKYGLEAEQPWTIVLHHPTPLDRVPYKQQLQPLLRSVAALPGEKIVSYPNTDTGSDIFVREIETMRGASGMHIFKSVPRQDYLNIFKYASLVVGNSSMGIIDGSYFKVPAVNVGNRQAGREHGANVVHADYDAASIKRAIKRAVTPAFRRRAARVGSPYGDGRASQRIVKGIEKYIGRKDLFHKKLTYV